MKEKRLDLFGGNEQPWKASDWTASDDRVRGGKSQSYLSVAHDGKIATFEGNLDVKTLGGAGFASQRTASDDASWDLSEYDGIELVVALADEKKYTFNIKDTLLPRDPDTGREQSTISYEYDFQISNDSGHPARPTALWIPWNKFNATYRGRDKENAPALDKAAVKRFGFMCRSFFGEQEGDFGVAIVRVTAVKKDEDTDAVSGKNLGLDVEKQNYCLLKEDQVDEGSRSTSTIPSRWSRAVLVTGIVFLSVWLFCGGHHEILLKARESLSHYL